MADPGEITAMLAQIGSGEGKVVERLLPLLYAELRAMAERRMRAERAGHTLGATALVHEAYLKLVDQDRVDWKNRAHFLSVAAMAMRRILVNHAEAKRAQKRGGGEAVATFDDAIAKKDLDADELIALHRALDQLAELDARQAKVIECRFFGGLTHEEIAEVLSVSVPTVRRDLRIAKAWLTRALAG